MSYGETTSPGWHPDPYGRAEYRWHDGSNWTANISTAGQQRTETADEWAIPAGSDTPDAVRQQVAQAAHNPRAAGLPFGNQVHGAAPDMGAGGGTVFTEPVLVVNQKAKVIEINNEYAVYNQHGTQIAAVRQVGQSQAKKVMRALTSFDQYMTHKLEVVDSAGTVLLRITRPAKFMKSRFLIEDGANRPIGEIVQENVFGKIRFGLTSGGHQVGSLNAENWRAWNFAIRDHTDTEVARVTKTWEGLVKNMFTTADNYVVNIHRPIEDPLRSLVVAAALSIDTALKQDNRGFN